MDKTDRDWLQIFSNAIAIAQIAVSTLFFGIHLHCVARLDEITKDLLRVETTLNKHIGQHKKNISFLGQMGIDAYRCFPEDLY